MSLQILFSELFPATPSPADQRPLWPLPAAASQLLDVLEIPLLWAMGHTPGRPQSPLTGLQMPHPGGLGSTEARVRWECEEGPRLEPSSEGGGPCGTGTRLAQRVPCFRRTGSPAPAGLCSVPSGPCPSAASLPLQPPQKLAEASEPQPLLSTLCPDLGGGAASAGPRLCPGALCPPHKGSERRDPVVPSLWRKGPGSWLCAGQGEGPARLGGVSREEGRPRREPHWLPLCQLPLVDKPGWRIRHNPLWMGTTLPGGGTEALCLHHAPCWQ